MQTLSPTLTAAYRDRVQYPVSKVEVVPLGAGPTDAALATIKVKGGTVDMDATRPVRRSLTNLLVPLDGANKDLVPRKRGDLLHPLSPHELRITYGRATGTPPTTPNLAPLIVCGFDKPEIVDAGDGPMLTITGQDRAARIQRARWSKPKQIRHGALIPSAIRQVVDDRWPALGIPLQVDFTACAGHPILTMTCPNSVFGSDHTAADPWADLTTLAAVGGCELYFGADGRILVVPYVDPDTAPIAATYTDQVNAIVRPLMGKVNRGFDVSRTYNGIIVTGGNSNDATCRAEWWDRDPNSDTYVETYGEDPAFFDSPLIRHEGQASIVAQGFGNKLKMGAEVLTLDVVPNGAFEGSDAMQVTRPDIMDTGKYLLEKFSLDIAEAPNLMTLTSRLTNSIEGVNIT